MIKRFVARLAVLPAGLLAAGVLFTPVSASGIAHTAVYGQESAAAPINVTVVRTTNHGATIQPAVYHAANQSATKTAAMSPTHTCPRQTGASHAAHANHASTSTNTTKHTCTHTKGNWPGHPIR